MTREGAAHICVKAQAEHEARAIVNTLAAAPLDDESESSAHTVAVENWLKAKRELEVAIASGGNV